MKVVALPSVHLCCLLTLLQHLMIQVQLVTAVFFTSTLSARLLLPTVRINQDVRHYSFHLRHGHEVFLLPQIILLLLDLLDCLL